VTKDEIKGEDMKKLEWYEDTEWGWTDIGVNKAKVWRTAYHGKEGSFDLEVYPVKLLDKDAEGWEYRIIEDNEGEVGEEYDATFESSNGNDHAPTAKVAMKWAEATLEDMLEERRAKKRKYD